MRILLIVSFLAFVFLLPVESDVLIYRDGSRIEGQVVDTPDVDHLLFYGGDETLEVDVSELHSVEVSPLVVTSTLVKEETKPSEDVQKILKQISELPAYPEAGAIYLTDSLVYQLNEDGTYTEVTHLVAKVLKDRRKRISFFSTSYDQERESVTVDLARTITTDGRVIELDPAMITDKAAFQGSEHYSRYKQKSFTLPEVTVGSIIEYKITRNVHKPLFEGYFAPSCYFGSFEPTIDCIFEVIIPASRTLNWSYRNLDNYPLLPRIEKSANRVSYSWERHNIPAIVEEANRPPFNEIVSSVACSMFADWQPIYEWNGDKLAKHMAETSPEITKQVEELTAGLMSDEEKIAAIYYWVQKEIRYISIKGDVVAGLAGHPARETFEKKYGDCVDKSVLMCAMLRQLGFDAHPVGAMTNGGGEWHQDIPRFYANHSFVYLRLKDGSVRWLDPTTTNYRYPYFREDDMGVMALVPTLKTRVRTSNPVIYEREYQKMITLDKSGSIEVKNAVQLAGSTEAAYRGYLKQLKDEERQDALEKIIGSSYSGASVLSPFEFGDVDELAKPFFLNQHYQVKNYAVIASDLMVFALPGIDKNYSGLVLEKRTYPIDYQVHTAFKGTIEVKIPAGYQLEYLPESLKFSNDYFNYQAEYLKTATGFTFTEDFQRVKCFIPVEEYKLFRDSARKIQDFTDKKVVLKQLTEGEEK